MADTTLSPTGLVQIEVGASDNTWGLKLNTNEATVNGWFSDVSGAPALKVANGGTGAATAATARTALGVPGLTADNALSGINSIGTLNNIYAYSAQMLVESVTLNRAAAMFMASNNAAGQIGVGIRTDRDDCYLGRFYYGATPVGSIGVQAGGVGVTFNATSDGRRKPEAERKAFSAGALIDAVRIYDFAWDTGTRGIGPIAQELAEVRPQWVTVGDSDPDARPGDERFSPWMTQMSEPVAVLWAEVQSLRARLAAAGL